MTVTALQDMLARLVIEAHVEGAASPEELAAARLLADTARWAATTLRGDGSAAAAADMLGHAVAGLKVDAVRRGDRAEAERIEDQAMNWADVICEVAPATPGEQLEAAADDAVAALVELVPTYIEKALHAEHSKYRALSALMLDATIDVIARLRRPGVDLFDLVAVAVNQLGELRDRLRAQHGADAVDRFDRLVRQAVPRICTGGTEPVPPLH